MDSRRERTDEWLEEDGTRGMLRFLETRRFEQLENVATLLSAGKRDDGERLAIAAQNTAELLHILTNEVTDEDLFEEED